MSVCLLCNNQLEGYAVTVIDGKGSQCLIGNRNFVLFIWQKLDNRVLTTVQLISKTTDRMMQVSEPSVSVNFEMVLRLRETLNENVTCMRECVVQLILF